MFDGLTDDYLRQRATHLNRELVELRAELIRRAAKDAKPAKLRERFIYALECQDGYYYIGQTTNIERRLNQHDRGKGSWFTRLHKPVRVIEHASVGVVPDFEALKYENDLTVQYMNRYGIHKVRGGAFIQRDTKYFIGLLNRHQPMAAVALHKDLDDQMLAAISSEP